MHLPPRSCPANPVTCRGEAVVPAPPPRWRTVLLVAVLALSACDGKGSPGGGEPPAPTPTAAGDAPALARSAHFLLTRDASQSGAAQAEARSARFRLIREEAPHGQF